MRSSGSWSRSQASPRASLTSFGAASWCMACPPGQGGEEAAGEACTPVSTTAAPTDVRAEPVQVKKRMGELPTATGSDSSWAPSSPLEETPASSSPESWPRTPARVNEAAEEAGAADEGRERGSGGNAENPPRPAPAHHPTTPTPPACSHPPVPPETGVLPGNSGVTAL